MQETYQDKLNLTLDQKILHFFEVVSSFYENLNGNCYLCFSGGLDSTVMKYLFEKFIKMANLPPVKVVFNNTTNEHKEVLDFVKSFGDQIIWLRPKITFAQSLLKNGYPVISKEQAMAISRYRNTKSAAQKQYRLTGKKPDGSFGKVGVISEKWKFAIDAPFKITEKCCDVLKKAPLKKFEKQTNLRPIIGTLSSESNQRKMQYIKHGCNVFTEGKEVCRPLSIFTQKDIWDLVKRENIQICNIYYDQLINDEFVTGEKTTGCALCGFGIHNESPNNNRLTRLHKRQPNVYKSYMDKLGYRSVFNYMKINLPDEDQQTKLNL